MRTLADLIYSGTTTTDDIYGDEWDAQLDTVLAGGELS